MIWDATEDDLPEILRMAASFASECGLDVEFSPATAELTATFLMENGVLLMGEGGMLGGIAYPHFFNADVLMAQEMFLWVDPDRRGTPLGLRLIAGYEDWARSIGAKHVSMVALASQKPVGRLYDRRGYRLMETSFVKPLWH